MNFEDDKPEMKKAEKKKKEERPPKAGEKGYDYYSMSSSKKILTGRGKI